MSLPTPENPDPLLEFSSEPGVAKAAAAPLEPAVQTVAAPVVAPPDPQPVQTTKFLLERIEQLERALKELRSQALALKSEMATIVRALADIRKQLPQLQLSATPPPRSRLHTATAIAGLILGLTIGVFGWRYFAGEEDVAMASPAPIVVAAATPVSAPIADSMPAPIADPVPDPPRTAVTQERSAPKTQQRPALKRSVERPRSTPIDDTDNRGPAPTAEPTNYVGTLSIDADPGGEVFINRKSVGPTPLRLTDLRAGSHLVWIEREGYKRWTRVVQVPAEQVTRVSAALERIAR